MQVSRDNAKILTLALIIMVLAVMYLLLFNSSLPNGVLQTLSPIIYFVEFLILVFGLLYSLCSEQEEEMASLFM